MYCAAAVVSSMVRVRSRFPWLASLVSQHLVEVGDPPVPLVVVFAEPVVDVTAAGPVLRHTFAGDGVIPDLLLRTYVALGHLGHLRPGIGVVALHESAYPER